MTYTIDKNIPIPSINRGGLLAVLEGMEVGDSVFVGDKKQATIAGTMRTAQKGNKAYTMRKENEGYRVWRTE